MGPGLHSRIEAQQFSNLYPHVAFLDQPSGCNFLQLKDWAIDVVKEQHRILQKPLTLLGHSFGAQLIAAALPSVGSLVSEVRFYGSAADPFDCFVNLEEILNPADAFKSAHWKTQSPEDKMNLIFKLAQNPGMTAAYWCDPQAQAHYDGMSAQHPPLNIGDFVHVFTDFLGNQSTLATPPWSGKAVIYYSAADNLICNVETVEPWKKIFPKANLVEIPAIGHYGLFESNSLAANFFEP
jgi:pimeloyl-ACP methyl ester carboxylesterase